MLRSLNKIRCKIFPTLTWKVSHKIFILEDHSYCHHLVFDYVCVFLCICMYVCVSLYLCACVCMFLGMCSIGHGYHSISISPFKYEAIYTLGYSFFFFVPVNDIPAECRIKSPVYLSLSSYA